MALQTFFVQRKTLCIFYESYLMFWPNFQDMLKAQHIKKRNGHWTKKNSDRKNISMECYQKCTQYSANNYQFLDNDYACLLHGVLRGYSCEFERINNPEITIIQTLTGAIFLIELIICVILKYSPCLDLCFLSRIISFPWNVVISRVKCNNDTCN